MLTFLKLGLSKFLGLVAPIFLELSSPLFLSAIKVFLHLIDILDLLLGWTLFIMALYNYFHALIRIEKEWLLSFAIQAKIVFDVDEGGILARLQIALSLKRVG